MQQQIYIKLQKWHGRLGLEPDEPRNKMQSGAGGKNHALQGTSLVVQWLRLHAPKAGSLGLISSQGSRSYMPQLGICIPQLKILHTAPKTWCSQIKKKKRKESCTLGLITVLLSTSWVTSSNFFIFTKPLFLSL